METAADVPVLRDVKSYGLEQYSDSIVSGARLRVNISGCLCHLSDVRTDPSRLSGRPLQLPEFPRACPGYGSTVFPCRTPAPTANIEILLVLLGACLEKRHDWWVRGDTLNTLDEFST